MTVGVVALVGVLGLLLKFDGVFVAVAMFVAWVVCWTLSGR